MSTIPIFSVMIPTWNPNPDYLKQALNSVLIQDMGPEKMQIAVVDDCSSKFNTQLWLKENGYFPRVEFYQNDKNLGIGGAWNQCIENSRGEYVHILHQDDLLEDGFYCTYLQPILNKNADALFGRVHFINETGFRKKQSPKVQSESGFVKADLVTFVSEIVFQCPSVIVAKSLYEELGYFDISLNYALDREMWIRLTQKTTWYYVDETLSSFRLTETSQSGKLAETGTSLIDSYIGVDKFCSYLNEGDKQKARRNIMTRLSYAALDKVFSFRSKMLFSDRKQLLIKTLYYSNYSATYTYLVKKLIGIK